MQSTIALTLGAPISTPRLALEPMGERHADAFFAPLQEEPLYQWISMRKSAKSGMATCALARH